MKAMTPPTGLIGLAGWDSMCRVPRMLMRETVALCTRPRGHCGEHWMDAPAYPRIRWANRLRKAR